jgi:TRAP-type C4-dicarboxylate transport system permease small subunit
MIKKIDDNLHKCTLTFTAILLSAAVLLTFYQVLTRFILNDPAPWSELLARGIIIWGVFLGLPYAVRHGELISIDIIKTIFPKYVFVINTFVQVVILTVLGILFYYGIEVTVRVNHQSVALLNFSMSWLYAAIPIGCGLSIFSLLLRQLELVHHVIKLKRVQ